MADWPQPAWKTCCLAGCLHATAWSAKTEAPRRP